MIRTGTRRSRWVERLAHAFLPVTVAYVLFKIVDVAVFGPGVSSPSPLVSWGLWGPLAFFVTLCGALSHERGPMCPRCAAEMPIFPATMAWRHRRWLHMYHVGARLLPSAAILLSLCAGTIALAFLTDNRWWITLDFAYGILWSTSFNVHRTLRPWCPWCREAGRHGRHERLPSPDPSRA